MTAASAQTMSFRRDGTWMTLTWDRSLPGGRFSLSMMALM